MSNVKIAIYGGTFAPVHIGHIKSVFAYLAACDPDKLFIMPNYIPPHKAACAGDDPQKRLQMLKIAFSPLPYYDDKIIISDYELRNAETSYTYKTLEHFRWITDDLTFICGTDSFLEFETWKNYERIFELAKIAHIIRPSNTDRTADIQKARLHYEKQYGARIIDIPSAPVDISSTELRRMINEGKDTSEYIPRDVRSYIDKYNIYGKMQ